MICWYSNRLVITSRPAAYCYCSMKKDEGSYPALFSHDILKGPGGLSIGHDNPRSPVFRV
jgi:hypothetical protein